MFNPVNGAQVVCPKCGALSPVNALRCPCGNRLRYSRETESFFGVLLLIAVVGITVLITRTLTLSAAKLSGIEQSRAALATASSQSFSDGYAAGREAVLTEFEDELSKSRSEGYFSGYKQGRADLRADARAGVGAVYIRGQKASSGVPGYSSLISHISLMPPGNAYNYGYETGYADAKSGYELNSDE